MRVREFFRIATMLGIAALASTTASAQQYLGGNLAQNDPADQSQFVTVSAASLHDLVSRVDMLEASANLAPKDGNDTHDEKWKSKWGGRIQGDYVQFANETPQPNDYENYFEFRRLRLFTSGQGYGIFEYKLQFEFEGDENVLNGVQMKDAYLGINEVPFLGTVRFGHFKAPFSFEELTSSKYITFMERALPNLFAPGREVGVTAYNYTASENATWAYGIFFDDISETGREREADGQGPLLAARGTWTPYYDEPSEGRYMLHVGASALHRTLNDDAGGVAEFGSRPEVHEEVSSNFVTTGPLAGVNNYYTLGGEVAWVRGPLSIQAEGMTTRVGTATGNVDLHGAYAYASYFLTGESRGETYKRTKGVFDRIKPYENFWVIPGCIGKGAWEVKARVSYVDFTDAQNEQLTDMTFGFNWYWNPYTRYMFDWIHPFGVNTDRDELDILAMRMQVDF